MDYLLNPDKDKSEILPEKALDNQHSPNREITEIAATAQGFQPTGYTLQTTVVSDQCYSIISG